MARDKNKEQEIETILSCYFGGGPTGDAASQIYDEYIKPLEAERARLQDVVNGMWEDIAGDSI